MANLPAGPRYRKDVQMVLENIIICTDNVNRIEILNTMIRKARRLALLRRERGCFLVHSTLGVLND